MKIRVVWPKTISSVDTVDAMAACYQLQSNIKYDWKWALTMDLKPHFSGDEEYRSIALETEFVQDALRFSFVVMQVLRDNHDLKGTRILDGAVQFSTEETLLRRIDHLEDAILVNCQKLKKTRGWIRDRRIAEIRENMENRIISV